MHAYGPRTKIVTGINITPTLVHRGMCCCRVEIARTKNFFSPISNEERTNTMLQCQPKDLVSHLALV